MTDTNSQKSGPQYIYYIKLTVSSTFRECVAACLTGARCSNAKEDEDKEDACMQERRRKRRTRACNLTGARCSNERAASSAHVPPDRDGQQFCTPGPQFCTPGPRFRPPPGRRGACTPPRVAPTQHHPTYTHWPLLSFPDESAGLWYIYMYVCVCVCVCLCVRARVCVGIYEHTHSHARTHTHAHITLKVLVYYSD
jgi:hypothetical protein